MIERLLTSRILEALADRPVVLLHGPRQAGKSTLVRKLAEGPHRAEYLTLDDLSVLAAATSDPMGFVRGLPDRVVIDEIQKAPELFPALKAEVDRDRRPGRFLLTGSAHVLLLPRLSESLAGRMEILTLWPLSRAERKPGRPNPVDLFFGAALPRSFPPFSRDAWIADLALGGYPEPIALKSPDRRHAWFDAYLATLLQRDIRDLAEIEGVTLLPRLLSVLSGRLAGLLNASDLSRSLAMPLSTVKRYLSLLQAAFLLDLLPAWSGRSGARLAKAPKTLLVDTGLAAHLLGAGEDRLKSDPMLCGPLTENFVAMELRKLAAWSRTAVGFHHFRSHTGAEVDLVLEERGGRIVGVEIKAGGTLRPEDFRGLKALAELAGPRFHRGVLLYAGSEAIPFGARLHALPLSLI